MTAIRRTWLDCDRTGCEATHPEYLDDLSAGDKTPTEARRTAAENGWTYRREDGAMVDVCGGCSEGEP